MVEKITVNGNTLKNVKKGIVEISVDPTDTSKMMVEVESGSDAYHATEQHFKEGTRFACAYVTGRKDLPNGNVLFELMLMVM